MRSQINVVNLKNLRLIALADDEGNSYFYIGLLLIERLCIHGFNRS